MEEEKTQTSDNDRLKKCKTNFKFNPKPSYCVAYVTSSTYTKNYDNRHLH